MESGLASRTALGVALRRAVHQLADKPPHILDDPIAVPILGEKYRAALADAVARKDEPGSKVLRTWVVMRSRYAEDKLAEAVARGVRQYVLLGAGLDTFAHRNPHPNLRVFEVDYPATQEWKRSLLAQSNLPPEPHITYVPVDFEQQDLAEELARDGFDFSAPAVFAWLGVIMYLPLPAFRKTISTIATLPNGSAVIMDYALPASHVPLAERLGRAVLEERVKRIGEPFQLFLTPQQIREELAAFTTIEDLDAAPLNERYFANRRDKLRLHGHSARIVCAWR